MLHTTQELSVLLVTDTVIHSLEITKKPKLLKTALAYILNLKTLACRARNIIRGIHASLSSACATNFPAVNMQMKRKNHANNIHDVLKSTIRSH